jgi:signal transduction histidine kinase
LPDPVFDEVNVHTWILHAVNLETRLKIDVQPGPDLAIQADRGQLDQLLINVISNAVEASLEAKPNSDGRVLVGWQIHGQHLQVWVDDDGPGLVETRDVFLPFFTTKTHGSGIGLTLSRQIAEAHNGHLTLENRTDKSGCRAYLWLPIKPE